MTCDEYYNIVHTDVESEKTHELHVTNREYFFFDQYIETAFRLYLKLLLSKRTLKHTKMDNLGHVYTIFVGQVIYDVENFLRCF